MIYSWQHTEVPWNRLGLVHTHARTGNRECETAGYSVQKLVMKLTVDFYCPLNTWGMQHLVNEWLTICWDLREMVGQNICGTSLNRLWYRGPPLTGSLYLIKVGKHFIDPLARKRLTCHYWELLAHNTTGLFPWHVEGLNIAANSLALQLCG